MSHPASPTDMFSIQLSKSPGESWYVVNSLEIRHPSFRHRLSFTADSAIGEVFTAPLAQYVERVIDRLDEETKVLSEPDAIFSAPGIVLGKMRVLSHTRSENIRQVIIRFAYFVGGVQAVIRQNTHFDHPTMSHREMVAVSALIDICFPAFDIINSNIYGGGAGSMSLDVVQERLMRIADAESDLVFYLNLLKRYVASFEPVERVTLGAGMQERVVVN